MRKVNVLPQLSYPRFLILMDGQAYISHKNKLIVFWSPKCASSAIFKWFSYSFVNYQISRRMLSKLGYSSSGIDAQKYIINDKYTSVFVTRNPYTRIVSSFLNKFYVKNLKPILLYDQLEPFARLFIDQYNHFNNLPNKALDLNFFEFLRYLKYCLDNKIHVDHHWDTQVPRNPIFCIKPDFILKQENLRYDLIKLNNFLGIDNFIPDLINITSYNEKYSESAKILSKKSTLHCHENRIALNYNNLLSSDCCNLILNIFKKDFLFFDYPLSKKF